MSNYCFFQVSIGALITAHLPVGPVLEIADRELFEEWIGIDKLFSRCPAGRVGARHECSRVGIFRNGQDGHGSRGTGKMRQVKGTRRDWKGSLLQHRGILLNQSRNDLTGKFWIPPQL